jgi:hypothetical protein
MTIRDHAPLISEALKDPSHRVVKFWFNERAERLFALTPRPHNLKL